MSNKAIRMLISISLNVLVIVLGIYLVFTIGSKCYSFGEKVFNERSVDEPDNARTVQVTVPNVHSTATIAKLLYDKGLVEDEMVAYFQIIFSDYKDNFVSGTYELNTGMKPTQMLEILCPTGNEQSKE